MSKPQFDKLGTNRFTPTRDRRKHRWLDFVAGSARPALRFGWLKSRFVVFGLWFCVIGLFFASVIQFGLMLNEYDTHFGKESNAKRLIQGELKPHDLTSHYLLYSLANLREVYLRHATKGIPLEEVSNQRKQVAGMFANFDAEIRTNAEFLNPSFAPAFKVTTKFFEVLQRYENGKSTIDEVLSAGDDATNSWFKLVSQSTQTDTALRIALKTEFNHFESATLRLLIVFGGLVVLSVLTWIALIALNRRNVLRERKRFSAFETIIASIGHDFGNPLGTIQEAILMLSKELPAHGRKHFYTLAHKATHSLTRLVTDILQVTHGEPLTVELQSINIENWFADFVALYESKVQKKGLKFKASIATHPMLLSVDPDRLNQCIGNLMDNAIRYTKSGEIELTLSVRNQARGCKLKALVIKVKDTGIGIAPEDLDRIFLPFERAQDAVSRKGMGLGLSIVHNIAKRSGGTVEVQSKLGQGSTFTFLIPVEEVAYISVPWEENSVEPDTATTTEAEILVVGDDADVIAATLDEAGYSVNTATNSKTAMNLISAITYQVVVISMKGPDLTAGLDLASVCKKRPDSPYTIAITTSANKLRKEDSAMNFDEILTKPVTIDTLMRSMGIAFGQAPD